MITIGRGSPGPSSPGLCMCGCGQPTPLATRTNTRQRLIKGQPTHYLPGHQIPATETPLARFTRRVDRSGGPEACWLWVGATRAGYGDLRVGRFREHAHRFAWQVAHGPIPAGLQVCHKCDTPRCCHAECAVPGCPHLKDTPGCQAHLFLGTPKENMQDKMQKGRGSQGARNASARLTEAEVLDIRRRLAAGNVSQSALAREYGVQHTTINLIARGKKWRYLLSPTCCQPKEDPNASLD